MSESADLWLLALFASALSAAGLRWRSVRVVGAVAVAVVAFAVLDRMPGSLARLTVDVLSEGCSEAELRDGGKQLYSAASRGASMVMICVAPLAVWSVFGERWSKKKSRMKPAP